MLSIAKQGGPPFGCITRVVVFSVQPRRRDCLLWAVCCLHPYVGMEARALAKLPDLSRLVMMWHSPPLWYCPLIKSAPLFPVLNPTPIARDPNLMASRVLIRGFYNTGFHVPRQEICASSI